MELKFKPIEKPKKLELVPLRNDRPLEQYELEAESNAIELSIKHFKRIPPLPGTLGYLFRDLIGGNQAVYNFVKSVLHPNIISTKPNRNGNAKDMKAFRIIKIWNAMDEFSQNRVDVFDWLCDRFELAKDDFYAYAAKGMFNHFDAISQRIIMETKPEVIHNVRQFARSEKNFRDRELAAKATGLTKEAPLIGNIDASTKVNANLNFSPSFNSMLKEADAVINEDENFIEAEEVEPKQLTEGSTEFLNTEVKKENEEELLAILRRK